MKQKRARQNVHNAFTQNLMKIVLIVHDYVMTLKFVQKRSVIHEMLFLLLLVFMLSLLIPETYLESLVVNNNFIYYNMSPKEYDADIFF